MAMTRKPDVQHLFGTGGAPQQGVQTFVDELTLSNARAKFSELVSDAADRGRRSMITWHGQPRAAIVPAYDLVRLQRLDHEVRACTRIASPPPETAKFLDLDDDAVLERTFETGDEAGAMDSAETDRRVGALVRELVSNPDIAWLIEQVRNGTHEPAEEERHGDYMTTGEQMAERPPAEGG